MATLVSLELRWFYGGKFAPEVFEWFRDALPGPALAEPDTREDIYLYQPEYQQFGIKLRRRKPGAPYSLEIKWRESAQPFSAPGGVVGQAERWHKLAWHDARGPRQEDIAPLRLPRGPWLTVGKKRWQRRYAWDERAFVPVANDQFPEFGAAIELTALELFGEPHSTVLVEAFAPARKQQERVLAAAIAGLWRDHPGPLPGRERSYGYPFWLAWYGAALAPRLARQPIDV